ncbi:hypothetical protein [Moorena sp. SIOASIH]|nr:hypothetical protein [Moorena sp. SIOASIH]
MPIGRPPYARGVRGDSSCLLPLACSLLPTPYSLLPIASFFLLTE